MENPYLHSDKGKLVRRHVDWTEEGQKLSGAEKEKVIEEFDRKVREDAADVVVIPRSQMEEIAKSLTELRKLGRMEVEKWLNVPSKECELRLRIFNLSEFPSLFANQCLSMNPKGK